MSFRNKGTTAPTVVVSVAPDYSGNYVCSGANDDVEIQAAIDYAAPGGIVYIKGGDYNLAQTINLTAKGPITLIGAGEGDGTGEQTRLIFANDATDCLSADDVGSHLHLQIKDLRIRGPNSGTGNGIYLRYCRMAIIDNVQCERFGDSGIKFSNTTQSRIVNCRMTSNDIGITLERNAVDALRSNNNYVLGGASLNNTTHGVYINRSQGNLIDQDIEGNANGVYLDGEGTQWNEIRGWIEGNTTGVNIPNATVLFTKVRRRVLSGNVTNIVDLGDRTDLPQVFSPVTDPDTLLGTHPTAVLPDAVDTSVYFQIQTPNDFQDIVTADVIVVQTATAGPPNMQWSTASNFGRLCGTQNYNTHTDSETDQTTAVDQNDLTCIDVSASLTDLASGDLVGFEFIRRGTQAGDTINADAYYLGFRLRYI